MKILRAADYKTMPWKNGLGSTTEIAIAPDGATLDDFEWRVSMAQVSHDGPFSSFADIDRTLLVLKGNGIDLVVDNATTVRIDRDAIHAFPGDRPTTATLIDGPIVDLNVMTRRDICTHRVERIIVTQSQDFTIAAPTLFVIEHGVLDIASHTLGRYDAVIVENTTPMLTFRTASAAQLIIIRFG